MAMIWRVWNSFESFNRVLDKQNNCDYQPYQKVKWLWLSFQVACIEFRLLKRIIDTDRSLDRDVWHKKFRE